VSLHLEAAIGAATGSAVTGVLVRVIIARMLSDLDHAVKNITLIREELAASRKEIESIKTMRDSISQLEKKIIKLEAKLA
jgi:septal ring factor EnvC (AmiA/AmiB activator)